MSVSHELRTPLTAIRGHADALVEGLAEDPEARDASLEVIRTETRPPGAARRRRARPREARRAPVRARRAGGRSRVAPRSGLPDARARRARQHAIEYEREFASAPVIVTDGDRVLQIVSNLLENAFHWTPDGGRVALGLAKQNGSVSVTVSDSGPGIPIERARADLPAVLLAQRSGNRARARDRERARRGARWAAERRPPSLGEGARFELRLPA